MKYRASASFCDKTRQTGQELLLLTVATFLHCIWLQLDQLKKACNNSGVYSKESFAANAPWKGI